MKNYKSISLPSQLLEELEGLATDLHLGYASLTEVVKDAIRDKIAEFHVMLDKRPAKAAIVEGS